MADPKNDASTDIEAKVKAFVKDLNSELAKLSKPEKGEKKKAPVITFSMSRNKVSGSRTPAEQAALLVKGSTKVCWSSHMADSARHVLLKVDGKPSWDPKAALGAKFGAFKSKWSSLMKKHGLKNASGGDGWPGWDQFHFELPNSKIAHSDKRAKACLEEYARLTRKEGKSKNASFEKKYSKLLAPYLKKYEPKK